MRRFWHPVALTSQVKDVPLPVRRFGEDLILFRDKVRPLRGSFTSNAVTAMRRSSSAFCVSGAYAAAITAGFTTSTAHCSKRPLKPMRRRSRKSFIWALTPLREYKGLVFAYMGPTDSIPDFPIYDTFEIEGGELVPYEVEQPCNWLQIAENSVDPYHVVFLHTRVNLGSVHREARCDSESGLAGDSNRVLLY